MLKMCGKTFNKNNGNALYVYRPDLLKDTPEYLWCKKDCYTMPCTFCCLAFINVSILILMGYLGEYFC